MAETASFLTFGGKDAAPAPDAYAVLGVEPKVDASAARRQFMKLSLWVHPDKNPHPRAVDAFHAADVAFKTIKVGLGVCSNELTGSGCSCQSCCGRNPAALE